MRLKGEHVTVVGLGMTGTALARFLLKRGAVVKVTDSGSGPALKEAARKLESMGARVELGGHSPETFEKAGLVLLSPGVPHTLAPFAKAREKGVPVLGEIEFASGFVSEPIAAVTGTNGKTTVTTLLGDMLKCSGLKTFVGGNIGAPLIDYVDSKDRADVLVLELSSFQLDTIVTFRPKAAVLLNITDDHMDRYPDFQAYANSKARIFENQGGGDFAVLNGSDPAVQNIAGALAARKLFFHRDAAASGSRNRDRATIATGPGENKPKILFDLADAPSWELDMSDFRPSGIHNLENAAAAALAALCAGASRQGIASAVKSFRGLPHRLEKIVTANGVDFVNDSKATNTDAVIKAIETFDRPVIVIMGGRDKDGDFTALKETVRKRVKRLVLIGEAAEKIGAVLKDSAPVDHADSMDAAVGKAHEWSAPGDVVLLAPGCASFDWYANYKERGGDFRRAAERIASNAMP